jgi:uncharacterized glyoxalase superfamily protein PhnB
MAEPNWQAVVPMLAYEDSAAALAWLARAFGFVEQRRTVDTDGRITHAEMDAHGGLIMLSTPTPDYESPAHHRESCVAARRWSEVPWVIDGVLVYVADVAEHCAQAQAAGARLLSEIETDFPGPRYRAEDPEGHRWMFLEPPAHPAAEHYPGP